MRWPWTKAETDLDREVRHHLDALADSYQKQGMSRAEAMRHARIDFGGVERFKDECRDESVWSWLANSLQDVRFGWRMMRKTPAITLAAVLSLALGIGATTAILSLADALLWKTIGAPAPEQLVEVLWESKARADGLMRGSSGSMFKDGAVRVADFFSNDGYKAMRARAAMLQGQVAAHNGSTVVSTSFAGRILVARVRPVSGNFFNLLQLQPFEGRLISDSDDTRGSSPVVVVTYRYWRQNLGADPAAIGKSMRINNTSYTIAGVLPPKFLGLVPGEETDLYTPIMQSPAFLDPESFVNKRFDDPMAWLMQVVARRPANLTEDQFRSQLDTAFATSWPAQPKNAESTPHVRISEASRGLGQMRRRFGDPVWMLLGLVSLVLLVACANIANLLLARAAQREKEVALRVSLGCSGGRLVRQFFTESVMLAAMGGALSIGVAWVLGLLMTNLVPQQFDGMTLNFEPNLRSLAGTAVVSLLTAVLFGLYPAWRTARVDSSTALKEGAGAGGTVSKARWVPARLLVLAQVALGVLLVTSAIVFTSHLNELANRDTGFERGHSILFDVRPGEIGYKGDRLRQFYFDLEERLGRIPGVENVGLARTRPMRGGGYWDGVRKPGQTKELQTAVHHVNPAFFEALGVPIAAGRQLTPQEARTNAKVMVISEDLLKDLETTSPLGMQLEMSGASYTVVGVARQARYSGMHESPSVVYLPFDYERQSVTVVVRTSTPPIGALGAIRAAVKEMDRDLPLVDIFTMEQQISRTLQRERLFAWLCGSFGVLALVLCVVGLYGLMSHTTARRTPEIGIRIALGASRGDVLQQVLLEGMKLAIVGLVLGVPLAVYGTHLAETQKLLPEGPLPYAKLAAAIAILTISAIAAVLGPAIRASSVDPMRALRRG